MVKVVNMFPEYVYIIMQCFRGYIQPTKGVTEQMITRLSVPGCQIISDLLLSCFRRRERALIVTNIASLADFLARCVNTTGLVIRTMVS